MREGYKVEEKLDLIDWLIAISKPDKRLLKALPNEVLWEIKARAWKLRAIFVEEMLRRCMEKLKRYERGVRG